MPHITLTVTQSVIDQVTRAGESQRQMAIKDASPELASQIQTATAANRIRIPLLNAFDLTVGDTSAIWYSHQVGIQAEDFINLYQILARRPEQPIRFTW
jgi:hypothetical protein